MLPGAISKNDVYAKVGALVAELQVINKLTTYGRALQTIEDADDPASHYSLMVLRPSQQS